MCQTGIWQRRSPSLLEMQVKTLWIVVDPTLKKSGEALDEKYSINDSTVASRSDLMVHTNWKHAKTGMSIRPLVLVKETVSRPRSLRCTRYLSIICSPFFIQAMLKAGAIKPTQSEPRMSAHHHARELSTVEHIHVCFSNAYYTLSPYFIFVTGSWIVLSQHNTAADIHSGIKSFNHHLVHG